MVELLDNGLLAITVDDIDKLGSKDLALPHDRLLTESATADAQADSPTPKRLVS